MNWRRDCIVSRAMRTLLENRQYGFCVLIFTSIILFYYTLWVIVLPFVDEDYLPHVARFFPPIHLAFAIPLGLGTFVGVLLFSRAFYLVSQDRREEQDRLKIN